MPAISKQSPLPLYYQLKELLREKIEEGQLKPGDVIPPERELCETYGISRMTARQAITELVNEGLLYREQGKGTFVARPKIEQRLLRLTSFTEDMQQRGLKPETRLLSVTTLTAKPALAAILAQPENEPVLELVRLRLADGEPMAIERSYLPAFLVPHLLTEDFTRHSLYRLLEQKCGLILGKAKQTLEPALANQQEAGLLGIVENAPVLLIKRTTFLGDGRPVEYVKSTYRGDRYKFYVELERH